MSAPDSKSAPTAHKYKISVDKLEVGSMPEKLSPLRKWVPLRKFTTYLVLVGACYIASTYMPSHFERSLGNSGWHSVLGSVALLAQASSFLALVSLMEFLFGRALVHLVQLNATCLIDGFVVPCKMTYREWSLKIHTGISCALTATTTYLYALALRGVIPPNPGPVPHRVEGAVVVLAAVVGLYSVYKIVKAYRQRGIGNLHVTYPTRCPYEAFEFDEPEKDAYANVAADLDIATSAV